MFKGVFPRDNPETYKWHELADEGLPSGGVKESNLRLLKALRTRMTQNDVLVDKDFSRKWNPFKQSSVKIMDGCKSKFI